MAQVSLDNAQTTGHGQFPPTTIQSSAQKVVINGKPPLLNGDTMATHCDPNQCHGQTVIAQSQKVFVNGKPVVQVGDSTGCGDTVQEGSSNVFIG